MAKIFSGLDLQGIIKKVGEKKYNTTSRPKVGSGTFKCKLYKAENTDSQKGNKMSKLTFEVVDGESKGGLFNHYTLHNFSDNGVTDGEEWKVISIVLCAEAYNINTKKIEEDEDVESFNDFIYEVTNSLQKKVDKGFEPTKYIQVVRKENGTNTNGQTQYKNFFSSWVDEVTTEDKEKVDAVIENAIQDNALANTKDNSAFWEQFNQKKSV